MSLPSDSEKCSLSKLTESADDDSSEEYELRNAKLDEYFTSVLNTLEDLNLRENLDIAPMTLGFVYVLYKELSTLGPWHTEKLQEASRKLNSCCALLYGVPLDDLLKKKSMFNTQRIFDQCIQDMHQKLTSEDFKSQPSLIEVYCFMMEDIPNYHDVTITVKVLPVSLFLMEDYDTTNKIKGLRCCRKILQYLTEGAFTEGNYYEVIFASLNKALTERDIEVTYLATDCIIELFKHLPADSEFKLSTSEILYTSILDQIIIESNLHRKAALFNFTKYLITLIKINSVVKKDFIAIICDNLDVCCNDGVEEIMLVTVVQCLEEWIKYCWCAWRLRTGRQMLSCLLKILYTCNDVSTAELIIKIIATFISICGKEDKSKILQSFENSTISNERYKERLSAINNQIIVE